MIRLSIIIPMYNVAPFVERCIRSLEDQDIPKDEYELICINDGSPDNCGEIVEQLQQEFSNIVLIKQENQGVSMARNNAMAIAKGKYLLMIDPDDYVKPNILKDRLHQLISNNLDVGFTGYIILDESYTEQYRFDPYYKQNNVLTGIHFYRQYMKGKSEIRDPNRSWAIFLKNDFIKTNKLYYLQDVPYLEDGEFMARVYSLGDRVSFINDPFYLRTTRPGSATHSRLYYSDKAIKGFIKAARNLKEFQENQVLTASQKIFLNQPIVKFCLLAVIACSNVRTYHKVFWVRKALINKNLNNLELEDCSIFYTKYGSYFNKSIYCFLFNYLFFKAKTSLKSILKKTSNN